MKVYILGAGPTGLAIADGLSDLGLNNYEIFDSNKEVGGLAQTLTWENIGSHDLGPHKIFTLDKNLMSRVKKLISPKDWITQKKISSIFINGHYLDYPPSPLKLRKVFGYKVFIYMCFGYISSMINIKNNKSNPKTFKEDIVNRTGAGLYKNLFKPISLKLWGNPSQLDSKLSKGRVQTPSLLEILKRLFKVQSKVSNYEALEFDYPSGGLGKLWNAIKKKNSKGYNLSSKITEITLKENRIESFCYSKKNKEYKIKVNEDDLVVSTLPIGLLNDIFTGKLITDELKKKINKTIVLNDLYLVFFHIEQKKLFQDSWIFIPDKDIIFHRISEQASFDKNMVKKGSILCCEIMNTRNKNLQNLKEEEIYTRTIEGLKTMGFYDIKVLKKKIIKLPKSYPVFFQGYEKNLEIILQKFDKISNFRTIGRQGSFNYIGTLDAMDIGYGLVNWITKNKKDWSNERKRTKHYPVLD
jgi:protoporphyrinogen oxidase